MRQLCLIGRQLQHICHAFFRRFQIKHAAPDITAHLNIAARCFDNVGKGKDGGLEGLQDFIPNIKKAYLIGETANQFASLLGEVPFDQSGTLDVALQCAASDAIAAGEEAVVLLAPACASFDQFPSFEHRGNEFRKQALALINKDHS